MISPVVLSVDDDEDAHVLMKRAFAKSGESVRLMAVNDGLEAIQYLSGEGNYSDRTAFPLPNLMLVDLKMPRVDGFGVLNFLRARPDLKQIRAIVFSSSPHEKDVQQVYSLGCTCYVVKPTDFQRLIQLVRAIEAEFLGLERTGDTPPFEEFCVPKPATTGSRLRADDRRAVTSAQTDMASHMYKLLVDQIKDYAVFMLDTTGHVLTWNEGARRIKGYEPHEIIGKHFSIFYPPQDKDNDKPELELRLAREIGRYEEEGWRMRKDGSRFWANVVVTPLYDSEGILSGFAKVTRDLTQRKLQQENLQNLLDSEERFRLLVEQVKDYAIFILDAKGNVASWNQGARRIKGYSSEEIIGKHFSIFYTQEDLDDGKPAREIEIAIREGRYEEEGWRVRKNGSRFWASVVITALWDKRGNLTGFAKVTRDLTEKKREQDALLQKTQELEAFAHTLSHDLRAPVRSISSFSDLLLHEEDLTEQQRSEYLGKITRAAQSMDRLITDILKLSQLSLAPAPQTPVSLENVLAETLSLMDAEMKERQAKVNVKKPFPLVEGNYSLLLQIFSNLIGNAIKFVPQGRVPQVEIFADQLNGHCEIHIRDFGIGIPEKYRESIFTMFDRGDTEHHFQGTGMGLAIVKRAVERIGGKIRIESPRDCGSDFVVTLNCFPDQTQRAIRNGRT